MRKRQRWVREESIAKMRKRGKRLQLGPDDPLIEPLRQAFLNLGVTFFDTKDQALDTDVILAHLLVVQEGLYRFRRGLALKRGDIVSKGAGHADDDLNVPTVR